MKKNFTLSLVAITLFAALVACGGESNIVGTWETQVTLEYLGWADLPADTLIAMGIDPNAPSVMQTKTFVADGTVTNDTIGVVHTGIWRTQGHYLYLYFTDSCCGFGEEERVRFSIGRNTLTLGSGSDMVEFARR